MQSTSIRELVNQAPPRAASKTADSPFPTLTQSGVARQSVQANSAQQSSASAQDTSSASGTTPNPSTELKDQFLRLLVAQIQQQDPLNPQDPSQFTSQLAQFSNLEQLVDINKSIQAQSQVQNVAIGTSAASFVGKKAEFRGDTISAKAGSVDLARYNLGQGSTQTTVNIYDQSGALVRTVNLGPQTRGVHDFHWDGLNDAGQAVVDGNYRIEVKAQNADGGDIETETSVVGRITGVRFADGNVILRMNEQNYTLSDLFGVEESV